MKKSNSRFNFINRVLASVLIVLHIATFGLMRDALAFSASSVNYRLDTGSPSSGGKNRSAPSVSVVQDTIGEPCVGKAQSASYVLNAGFIPTLQSDPPKQTQTIPNQNWNLNLSRQNAFNLDDYFSGNGALTYSYSFTGSHSISVTIDPLTHLVSFSQPADWFGTEKVKFVATDLSYGTISSNEVSLQVIGPSNAPVLEYIPDVTANEGELIKITPHATDADGNTITYTYTTPLNMQGAWQTGFSNVGIYAITVTATDSTGLKDTRSFCLTVNDVNRAPIVDQVGPITVNEGDTVVITPHAVDPDGNALYYYFTEPLDTAGKWLTGYDDAGTRTLYMFVSDGIASVSVPIEVTIRNVNRPPQAILMISRNTLNPSESFDIMVDATDPDGDVLNLVIKKNDEVLYSGPVIGSYSISTSVPTPGDYVVSAVVTDPGSLFTRVQQDIDVVDTGINRDLINPVMGDFNGDSLTDLGLHNAQTGEWEICLSEKGVFKAARRWKTDFGTSSEWWPMSGDYNGDGKTDAAIYNYLTGQLQVALSNGSSFGAQSTFLTASFASYSWQPVTGNFNGDKYADFALYNKDTGEVRVALGTGAGFSDFVTWIGGFGNDYIAMGGDFNGDGLTDLCFFKKPTGEFKVAFSNTKAFVDGTIWISGYAVDKDAMVSDFNHDGLADIGYWDKTNGNWYSAISTGARFEDKGMYDTFGLAQELSGTTGDFNGDGMTDLATFDRQQIGIDRWRVKLSTKKPCDILTDIDNGVGGKTKITYTYASKFGNEAVPFPVYVVSQVSLIDTLPTGTPLETYTQEFNYTDGYFDFADREFRGFAHVKVSDPITKNYAESFYYVGKQGEDGALKGQIARIVSYDGKNRKISEAVNTYEVKKEGYSANCLGFPSLKEQASTVVEENGSSLTTKSEFVYDNIGNVITEVSKGDLAKVGDEKSAETLYSSAYAAGFNRPLEVSLKDKDGNLVTKKNMQYYVNGNLFKEIVSILNPITQNTQVATSEYTYDAFGNVLTVKDALGRTVTTYYESTFNSYPERVVNCLNHEIKYEYDYRFGAVKKVTDPNNSTSSTAYDSLGRVTEVYNAKNELVTKYEYPDFNSKVTLQGNLSKTEYIDGIGRKYKAVSSGEDGLNPRQVASEVYYSDRGLVDRESMAHYVDEDPAQIAYVRYEYDLRGRAKKTTTDFPGTEKDAFSSVNFVTPYYTETTDPKGHKKGTLKDVYGNVIEVTEFTAGGVFRTVYEYDVQGNLLKVTDAKNNFSQIFYDSIGRKIKMIDPDMGIWTYEYDVLGNLKKQKDAKNQIIQFEYDELNRLTQKLVVTPGGAMIETLASYYYDDFIKPNCIGRLSKVLDLSGSTEFFYDTLGREIKSVKTIDGTNYTVQREYDIYDRLLKLTYPDGEAVNYFYDQNSGSLERVEGATQYVKDITYSAKGQIKEIKYGNGVTTDYTYGQDLRLSRILTQGGSLLQDLNYDFDKNGNVLTIADNLRSNIRNYGYDDLDRLTEARNVPDPRGGLTTFTYQYDSIGNMVYKSDTGVMLYGQNAGPHAVTAAGGNAYSYDTNGNMLEGRNKVMQYDWENRLKRVTEGAVVSDFFYDGDGGRVKKEVTSAQGHTSTSYIGSLYEIDSDGKTTKHIFAGANRVCSISPPLQGALGAETISYYHSDHLGSANVISDASGNLAQYCEYTPYGTTARNEGTDVVHHKFTGKELDSATGLYYYGARYYDPEIGRFITTDTIIQAPYDPQSLNRYSYCRNNPINYIDPSGHNWLSDIFREISRWFGQAVSGLEKATGVQWDVNVSASYSVRFGTGGATSTGRGTNSYSTPTSSGNSAEGSQKLPTVSEIIAQDTQATNNSVATSLNSSYGAIVGEGTGLGSLGGINKLNILDAISSPWVQMPISGSTKVGSAYFGILKDTIKEYAPGWTRGIGRAQGFQSAFQGLGMLQSLMYYPQLYEKAASQNLSQPQIAASSLIHGAAFGVGMLATEGGKMLGLWAGAKIGVGAGAIFGPISAAVVGVTAVILIGMAERKLNREMGIR